MRATIIPQNNNKIGFIPHIFTPPITSNNNYAVQFLITPKASGTGVSRDINPFQLYPNIENYATLYFISLLFIFRLSYYLREHVYARARKKFSHFTAKYKKKEKWQSNAVHMYTTAHTR